MPNREQEPGHRQPEGLPPELAEAFRGQRYACVTVATDQGTALFIKAPALEISRIPSPVPIRLQHFLYQHPAAPVIRMLLTIYDQPSSPLAMDTFINVEDGQQRAEYAALADQERIPLLFHDEGLRRRRGITVGNGSREEVRRIVRMADTLLSQIPRERFDFDRAKADVLRATDL